MIDGAVTTETTDAAVHVRRVIVINVIDSAIDPYPLHWVTRFPTRPHRLQFRIILLHLRMTVHARLGVRHVGLCRHFHKAVTIAAIHSQLRHMNVVRKRHRLNRFVADLCVLWRHVIPGCRGQSTDRNDTADHQFERYPVGPAWKEVGHGISRKCGSAGQHQPPQRINVEIGIRCVQNSPKGLRFLLRLRGNQRFYKSVTRWQNKIHHPISLRQKRSSSSI